MELEVNGQNTDFASENEDCRSDFEDGYQENVSNVNYNAIGGQETEQFSDEDSEVQIKRPNPQKIKEQEEEEIKKMERRSQDPAAEMQCKQTDKGINKSNRSINKGKTLINEMGINQMEGGDQMSIMTIYQNAVLRSKSIQSQRDSSSSEEPMDTSDELDVNNVANFVNNHAGMDVETLTVFSRKQTKIC